VTENAIAVSAESYVHDEFSNFVYDGSSVGIK
jgi:hypothetical protein